MSIFKEETVVVKRVVPGKHELLNSAELQIVRIRASKMIEMRVCKDGGSPWTFNPRSLRELSDLIAEIADVLEAQS